VFVAQACRNIGEGTEEQAGDVGESGGASSGDVAAGEEPKEMGEGMVDALGELEIFGAVGEQVGEVVGVGGWRFGVAGAELGLRVLDEASALAAGGGVVLAAFGRAGGFVVSFGVRARCFHGRSFSGSNFISKNLIWDKGVYPLFFEKRLEDIENKENRASKREARRLKRRLESGGCKT
jgi:hypothetical protein